MKKLTAKNDNKNLNSERLVYSLLLDVFKNGAYSTIALDKALKTSDLSALEKSYTTRLFYGILDKSIQFDFLISKLCANKPKLAIKIILKIGFYLLKYSSTPEYAAVNKTVDLAKLVGKGGTAGFINAVLKKSQDVIFPSIDKPFGLSVATSTPLWLVEILINDYGFEFTQKLLNFEKDEITHIRINLFNITQEDFEKKYSDLLMNSSKYGYYVTHNILEKMDKDDYIIQSFASISVIRFLFENKSKRILDLCAAPGGKSVLMKEISKISNINAELIACDIHEHRVELIKKYADSVGCNFEILLNDATVLNNSWINSFDFVLCDVPCSGIGVIGSKPDIAINRKVEDIKVIADLQKKIIDIAKQYVAKNGFLCYSTCTILKQENEQIINAFLKENTNFKLCNKLNLFPHIDNCDGFFAAKLQRIE